MRRSGAGDRLPSILGSLIWFWIPACAGMTNENHALLGEIHPQGPHVELLTNLDSGPGVALVSRNRLASKGIPLAALVLKGTPPCPPLSGRQKRCSLKRFFNRFTNVPCGEREIAPSFRSQIHLGRVSTAPIGVGTGLRRGGVRGTCGKIDGRRPWWPRNTGISRWRDSGPI